MDRRDRKTSGMGRLRRFAKLWKSQLFVLYLAARHPRTPRYAKLFAVLVTAYAFSPIDLIPDFIPVLGLLDDIVLVPLGIYATFRMIPDDVLAECREEAEARRNGSKPVNRWAGAVIVAVWLLVLAIAIDLAYEFIRARR